ncbi:O-antigen ligase [Mycolicibacterium sp. YH-1]|uniref:O-antigen ligase family protein n=1 Tax=Mycolicibacterium sp. YH-1 TaxID=2908837 RepID=UPI001F4BDBA6|nr:O-antigen ligase family protein [Mycolicibacterium sp. YH-1]UNB51460.1 O-antigen ligase family protein [Mycolicibacterium sp. YH-1]
MTSLQSARAKSGPPLKSESQPLPSHPEALRPSWFWTGFWSLIAALIPIMRLQSAEGLWQMPLRRVKYVIFLALIVSALFRLVARPIGLPVWLGAAVFIPFAGFLSGYSSSPTTSVIMATQLALLCALAPLVFRYHVVHTRDFLPWVLGAFLISQTLSATAGLIQLTAAPVLGQAAIAERSTGFAGHPNTLGIMSVIAILMTLTLIGQSSQLVKVGLWGAFGVNAVALIATGSLSAMLAGAVGAAVVAIGRRRVASALAVGVAAWGAGALFGLGNTWFANFVEYRIALVTGEAASAGDASLEIRALTYQWAFEHISNDPVFGVGMDNLNSGTFNGVTVVHNYLLHAWYQGGLMLFLWFVGVTAVVVVGTVRAIRSRRGLGGAAVATALIAFAATSSFFLQQQYWIPLLFAVAMLPVRQDREAPSEAPALESPPTGAFTGDARNRRWV